ncbi:MAG: serine/threonine protein kinase [Anaerolineales bacterium]|nr:serine/threonine protein kinase [Anaerolineales bacterium]
MEDLSGKQLGQYRVVAPLGEGGMAAVYKAYQPSVDRYVALKVLPRHYASDPNFIGRFEQEAKIIAKLEHPHIVPVHDYGESDGYTYLVMRYVKDGTLSDLLKGLPNPIEQTHNIISQIGKALDYAHSHGIIHRDIKPSNVLIDEQGNCLLTDFGIAKILEGTAHFTSTGGFVGTPSYASPEQGLGIEPDGRSDIYSLGVILYEMATGRLPFTAETPMAVALKHIHDPLPLPRTINPDLPEMIERVILKALAKEREDRYQTTDEMITDLEKALKGLSVKDRPEEVADPQLYVTTHIDPSTSDRSLPAIEANKEVSTPPTQPAHKRWQWAVLGAALVTIAVVAVFQFIVPRPLSDDKEAEPTTVVTASEQSATLTPIPTTPTSIAITKGLISGDVIMSDPIWEGHLFYIQLTPWGEDIPVYSTTLDAPGAYELMDIAPGDYTLDVVLDMDDSGTGEPTSADIFGWYEEGYQTKITLEAGQELTGIDISVTTADEEYGQPEASPTVSEYTSSISGTVKISEECEDGGSYPIEVNADIVGRPPGPSAYSIWLQEPGEYTITNIADGEYWVFAIVYCGGGGPGPTQSGSLYGQYYLGPNNGILTISDGEEVKGIDLDLYRSP